MYSADAIEPGEGLLVARTVYQVQPTGGLVRHGILLQWSWSVN